MPTPPLLTRSQPIPLHVAGNKCYVWDVEHVRTLRVDHHICGVLMGTLPNVAQQNIFLGLPLMLLPEEVAVLVNHRLAVLVDDAAAHDDAPDQHIADTYLESRKKDAQNQQEEAYITAQEKQNQMRELYKDKIDAKRKEKADKRKQLKLEQKELAQAAGLLPGEEEHDVQKAAQIQEGAPASPQLSARDTSNVAYSITIPGSSKSLPWHHPSSSKHVYSTLSAAASAGIYTPQISTHISDTQAQARVLVFQDLWKKGYYMGSGIKFGGDFLVYPGDPLRYHSHFTLTVLSDSSKTAISPMDIVAWGRLATAVKKAHLLAAPDYSDDATAKEGGKEVPIRYISLEWAGFG